MGNEVWTEMIKQSPLAAALLVMVFLFLRHIKEAEAARTENAKQASEAQRAHEVQMNNMWAINIKQLVEQMTHSHEELARILEQHDKADAERYERMGITKDLISAAKDKLKR